MNISSAVKTAKSVITANSPVLLVGTAIVGVVTTGVLSAKAGYKARGVVDERERELQEATPGAPPLTTKEKAKLTWPLYVVPSLTGAGAIASVAGVHTVHTQRHAALAGLYAVTSTKLDEYTERAEELLGPKKTQQISDEMAQRSVDRSPLDMDHEILILEEGTEVCHDEWSGRWFMGSMAIIERAANNINLQLAESGEASLNDFYEWLGLPPIPMGVRFGWSGKTKIDIKFGSVVTNDGRPAISFWFRPEPKDGLGIV